MDPECHGMMKCNFENMASEIHAVLFIESAHVYTTLVGWKEGEEDY